MNYEWWYEWNSIVSYLLPLFSKHTHVVSCKHQGSLKIIVVCGSSITNHLALSTACSRSCEKLPSYSMTCYTASSLPSHRKSTSLWRGTAEQTHATSFHKCRLRKRSCRSVNWREGKGKGKGNQMWYVMTHSEVGRLFREWWCEELDAWWEEQKMWWAWVLVVVYCMKLKREIMKNKDGLLTITDARLFEYMYHGCLQWLATKGTRYRS